MKNYTLSSLAFRDSCKWPDTVAFLFQLLHQSLAWLASSSLPHFHPRALTISCGSEVVAKAESRGKYDNKVFYLLCTFLYGYHRSGEVLSAASGWWVWAGVLVWRTVNFRPWSSFPHSFHLSLPGVRACARVGVHVCVRLCTTLGGEKRVSDPLEVKLRIAVTHRVW